MVRMGSVFEGREEKPGRGNFAGADAKAWPQMEFDMIITTDTAAAPCTTDARNQRAAKVPEGGLPRPRVYIRAVEAVLRAANAVKVLPPLHRFCRGEEYEQALEERRAAGASLKERKATLALLIEEAPWGQNGSVFVTDWSHFPHGKGRTRTLWVRGRRRAVFDDRDKMKVFPAEEAETEYQAERGRRRAAQAEYADRLHRLAHRLVIGDVVDPDGITAIEGWWYRKGDAGGYFFSPRKDGSWDGVTAVSVLGALRVADRIRRDCGVLADLTVGEHDHWEEVAEQLGY